MRFLFPLLGVALFGGAAFGVACSSANDTPAVQDAGSDSGAVLPPSTEDDGLNTTGVGVNVGFQRVLKGAGGATQLGIGVTWQGMTAGR